MGILFLFLLFYNFSSLNSLTCFIHMMTAFGHVLNLAGVNLECCTTVYCCLFMWWTSCSALFIDGCGALIRLKHTGLRSHLGVIIGLGGGISRIFPLWLHPLKSKMMWSRGARGRRHSGARERSNPGLSLIYLHATSPLRTVLKNRGFLLLLYSLQKIVG